MTRDFHGECGELPLSCASSQLADDRAELRGQSGGPPLVALEHAGDLLAEGSTPTGAVLAALLLHQIHP